MDIGIHECKAPFSQTYHFVIASARLDNWEDDSQQQGYFSNAFNPGELARLRRLFLLEMELDLIAKKVPGTFYCA